MNLWANYYKLVAINQQAKYLPPDDFIKITLVYKLEKFH